MITWRFGDSAEDGEVWLRNPSLTVIYVDYGSGERPGRQQWRRLTVVTKSWLEQQLAEVKNGAAGPLWAMIPSMLVLPDAEGEELRKIVDKVMQRGVFDDYSSPLAAR